MGGSAVDFTNKARGRVHWIRSDAFNDPANADLVDPITFQPVWQE